MAAIETRKMMLFTAVLASLMSLAAAQTYDADVLILGGGTAGLTAAKFLADKNVSFLIIEGASKIGGRIRSQMFGGIMVELGPASLYGTKENINMTVNMYNVSGKFVNFESYTVRTSSGTQPNTAADAAWVRLEAAQEKVAELYGEIKEKQLQDMSIRAALEYGNWFPKDGIDDVIEIYEYDYEFAKIPALISTQGFEAVSAYQEEPYLSTDSAGLEGMLKSHTSEFLQPNDPRLKLNEVVEKISYTESSVSVSTKSGKTFSGKYAIVTFSMGVLKSRSVTFEPVLPEWKLNTIYRTSMDVYTQVYVKFRTGISRFWDNVEYILHASPRRGYYPIILNMEADGFYPAGTNMIAFHIMGEEARRIERTDKATIKAEITGVLRSMYGLAIPEVEDILVTRWLDDPLTMGSFSSRQVGDTNPRFMDALTSPVGRVFFAGDAYHDTLDGFTEGAKRSAEATAMSLYDCMMNGRCRTFNTNPTDSPERKPTCGGVVNFVSFFLLVTNLMTSFIS